MRLSVSSARLIHMTHNFPCPAVRQASALDVPKIKDIIRISFGDVAKRFHLTEQNCPTHPSNCREEWIQEALAKGVRFYILEAEGKPCGCVALEPASPDVCYLERLAVPPDHRRRGYGRVLVAHALDEARALGAQCVDLGIIAEQTELRDWYRNIGFADVRRATFEHLPFEVLFMSMAV